MLPTTRGTRHSSAPLICRILLETSTTLLWILSEGIFVTAEVHHSVEIFDLKSGEHFRSIWWIQDATFDRLRARKNEVMVADGGDSAVVLISGEDFHRNRSQTVMRRRT
jgi:hypothetical protein